MGVFHDEVDCLKCDSSQWVWQAQQILKVEPPAGGLSTGQKVLVDNGRCSKGRVQEAMGGTIPSAAQRIAAAAAGGNVYAGGQPRQHRSVPRPS